MFILLQHFPREISKHYLRRNQKEITIRDVDLHEQFKCIIKTVTRMGVLSPFEKYMTKGWYNYVKTKGFRKWRQTDMSNESIFSVCVCHIEKEIMERKNVKVGIVKRFY